MKNNYNSYALTLLLLCIVSNCFSQWKTEAANNIKDDIIITYGIIYDKELSHDEKQSPEYLREITVALNKDYLIERKFGDKPKSFDSYTQYDYNSLKAYSCTVVSNIKSARQYDFSEPKGVVDFSENGEAKKILDFSCQKGSTIINKVPKEIYYTKDIGLKYCQRFKIDGFLLEYPGYSKTLGFYTVIAKKVTYTKLGASFYSLSDFKIRVTEEYKKGETGNINSTNAIGMEVIGQKAKRIKDISIKQVKIDSEKWVGDIIVYNFWVTISNSATSQISNLNELKEKYKDKNVHFVAVALDQEYDINLFLKKIPFNYDIIADGKWIADNFDIKGYPTNLIVDKTGTIQFYNLGTKSDIAQKMSVVIDKYLDQ